MQVISVQNELDSVKLKEVITTASKIKLPVKQTVKQLKDHLGGLIELSIGKDLYQNLLE